jgi:hypothetical protein
VNLIFASAEVLDGSGEVTARCEGTCAVVLGKLEDGGLYAKMRGGL